MKRLITGIVTLTTLAVGFWGCNDLSRTTYSGSDYVMFSDTLSMYPVQDSEKWFEIPVVATNICDYDRSFIRSSLTVLNQFSSVSVVEPP